MKNVMKSLLVLFLVSCVICGCRGRGQTKDDPARAGAPIVGAARSKGPVTPMTGENAPAKEFAKGIAEFVDHSVEHATAQMRKDVEEIKAIVHAWDLKFSRSNLKDAVDTFISPTDLLSKYRTDAPSGRVSREKVDPHAAEKEAIKSLALQEEREEIQRALGKINAELYGSQRQVEDIQWEIDSRDPNSNEAMYYVRMKREKQAVLGYLQGLVENLKDRLETIEDELGIQSPRESSSVSVEED